MNNLETIQQKKETLIRLEEMLVFSKESKLSNPLLDALEHEIKRYTPVILTREEYNELTLAEWENNRLDEDSCGEENESSYELKEWLDENTVIWWKR